MLHQNGNVSHETCTLRDGQTTLEMIAKQSSAIIAHQARNSKRLNIGTLQALPCKDQADQALEPVIQPYLYEVHPHELHLHEPK